MARNFGEGFRQPIDYETGLPIPGTPLIGSPSTNRPWNANGGGGYIQLRDELPPPVARDTPAGAPLVRDLDRDGM